MKYFLIPLLTALALPTAVNAANYKYHLIIGDDHVVPMRSKEACEKALQKILDVDNYQAKRKVWKPSAAYGMCLSSE